MHSGLTCTHMETAIWARCAPIRKGQLTVTSIGARKRRRRGRVFAASYPGHMRLDYKRATLFVQICKSSALSCRTHEWVLTMHTD